jgi:TonB family protein
MTCLLKRVLPFALALMVGVGLGTMFSKAPRTASNLSQNYGGIGTGSGAGYSTRQDGEVDYDRPFNPRDVDQKARIISRSEPQYTQEAREQQVQGTVVLRAVFAEDGSVKNIRVVSSLPYGLTERAVAAAQGIKFSPALKDGRAVSQYIQIEYNFNLF